MLDKSCLPSIPDYYRKEIDPKVNLLETPSIPCQFHHEVSGKSFSYSLEKDVWRCWGQCQCGGDVIDLHKLHMRMRTRKEAEESLIKRYNLQKHIMYDFKEIPIPEVSETAVELNRLYNRAVDLAAKADIKVWLELDYVMSQQPLSASLLKTFCETHEVI